LAGHNYFDAGQDENTIRFDLDGWDFVLIMLVSLSRYDTPDLTPSLLVTQIKGEDLVEHCEGPIALEYSIHTLDLPAFLVA
jgi:hypothetical protein